MTERLIERSFPIVQLNPLSVRERNAFKPVYKMHKWFARRSSSIFRAILLGAALPAEQDELPVDLMEEFYRGHGDDPRLKRADGSPLRVLDPFMGGGTTVVEALRLGFDVTGVDYNPIAWFIVKGETTPVDLDELDAAYERVAGKVKEELLELYRTKCPVTGKPADILYGFWVKQGICVDPSCGAETDLFRSYVVGRIQGDLGLYYLPDVHCLGCHGLFDWELECCTVTAGGEQVLGVGAAGKNRPEDTVYAFGPLDSGVLCPHCRANVQRKHLSPRLRRRKKKVLVQVVVDPSTGDFFEVRGALPDRVTGPRSGHVFDPNSGPTAGGRFTCERCGRTQATVESARAYGRPLPFRYFGFYAHSPHAQATHEAEGSQYLSTNNYKWFAPARGDDLSKLVDAKDRLEAIHDQLPLPSQAIYDGYNTNRLAIHQYRRWLDLYSPRQLLGLGLLLQAIGREPRCALRDALLGAFQSSVNFSSHLVRYNLKGNKAEAATSAHDYRNPSTTVEVAVWGASNQGRGSFGNAAANVQNGIAWCHAPNLPAAGGGFVDVTDVVPGEWRTTLWNRSSTDLTPLGSASVDLVVTDPPYAGSVQYAEMSDWSYVWLHHVLKDHYPDEFGPEITLKSQEIIEDGKEKDIAFFFENLTDAWRECHRVLVDDGLLVFTFHHREGDRWTGLLRSLFDAGFYLIAAYPTHSEALNSIVIQATKGITYDIIHVCRKRLEDPETIPWTVLRRDVLATARAQLNEIEGGSDVLPGPDVQMILLGKALMLFSQHYGKVLDSSGAIMDLDEAMTRILVLVREVRGESVPLPGPLQSIDALSQIALLHTVGRGPWTRDGLHMELRGYAHNPESLIACGLVEPEPDRKASLRSVPALDRWKARGAALDLGLRAPLIDRLHRLLGALHDGDDPGPIFRASEGEWSQLREGLVYLAKRERNMKDLCELAVRTLDARGPEPTSATGRQGDLFGGG